MINISFYSSCFEYAVYIAPEAGESLSAGMINCFGNVLAFFEIMLFEIIVVKDDKSKINICMYIMLGGILFAFILQLLVKENKKCKKDLNEKINITSVEISSN